MGGEGDEEGGSPWVAVNHGLTMIIFRGSSLGGFTTSRTTRSEISGRLYADRKTGEDGALRLGGNEGQWVPPGGAALRASWCPPVGATSRVSLVGERPANDEHIVRQPATYQVRTLHLCQIPHRSEVG